MIRPLRQRHRKQFAALGVLLPVFFVIGIVARKATPLMGQLPSAVAPDSSWNYVVRFDGHTAFPKSPVQINLWSRQVDAGPYAISFSADEQFVKPDLMVYWVPGSLGQLTNLPTNARLLGAFGPTPLPLPDGVAGTPGEVVLYSLADGAIVDVSVGLQLTNEGVSR